jgi:hypothetical protein
MINIRRSRNILNRDFILKKVEGRGDNGGRGGVMDNFEGIVEILNLERRNRRRDIY